MTRPHFLLLAACAILFGIGSVGAIPRIGPWEEEEREGDWKSSEVWEEREPVRPEIGMDQAWELLRESPSSELYLRWLEEAWEREGGDLSALTPHVESRAQESPADPVPWLIHARLQAKHGDPVIALIDLSKQMGALNLNGEIHGAYSRFFDEIEEAAREGIGNAIKNDVPALVAYLDRAGILEPEATFSAGPMSRHEPRTFLWLALSVILDGPEFRQAELVEAIQAQRPQHFSHVLLRLILTGEERRKQKAVNYLGVRVPQIDEKMPPEGQWELAAFFRQLLARTPLPAKNPKNIETGIAFIGRHFDLRGDGDLRRLQEAGSFRDLGQDAGSAGAFGYRWVMSTFYERPELAERGFERLLELAEDPDFQAEREDEVRPAQSYGGEVLHRLLNEHGNFISVGFVVRLLRKDLEIGNVFDSRLQYAINWSFTQKVKGSGAPLEALEDRLRFLVSEAGEGSYAMLADGFFHFFEELAERDPEMAEQVRARFDREDLASTDVALAMVHREVREAIRFHDWSVAVAGAKEAGEALPPMAPDLEEHYLAALTGSGMGESGHLLVARFLTRHGGKELPPPLMAAVVDLSVDRLEHFRAWDRDLRGLDSVLAALVRRDRESEEWREWARAIVVPFVRNAAPRLSENIYSGANQRVAAAVLDMAVELDLRAQVLALVERHGDYLPVMEVFAHLANVGLLDRARGYLESEWPRILKSTSFYGLHRPDLFRQRAELLEGFTDPGLRFLAEIALASLPDHRDEEMLWFMLDHFQDLSLLDREAEERPERSRRMEALATTFAKVRFPEEGIRRTALLMLGQDPFAARALAPEIEVTIGSLAASEAFDPDLAHQDYELTVRLMHLQAWLEADRGEFSTLNRWLDECLTLEMEIGYRQKRFLSGVQSLVLLPRSERVWPRLSEAEIGEEFATWRRVADAFGKADYTGGNRSLHALVASGLLSGRESDLEAWWQAQEEAQREFFQVRFRNDPIVFTYLKPTIGEADAARRRRVLERVLATLCVKELYAPGFNWTKSFPAVGVLSEAELVEWGAEWVVAHPWNGWNAAYLSFHFEEKGDWDRAFSWMEKAVELAGTPEHRTHLMVRQATQLDRAGRVAEARRVVDAIDRETIGGTGTPDYFRQLLEKHGWE